MTARLICPNGIDAETGDPLLPPTPVEVVAEMARGRPIAIEDLLELQARRRLLAGEADYGVMAGVDANDLAQAGWGVIFAFEDESRIPALHEALSPLLERRREQAGDLYRDAACDPRFLCRPNESKNAWLARNGGAPGPVDPRKTPYYLLIVGDPDKIPFRFQYQLDVAHAVGRIHFDTIEEYDSYACSVVAAEDPAEPPARAREIAFFGVRNERDRATALSVEHLVMPLADAVEQKQADWRVRRCMAARASRGQLARLLGGEETPALLFSASHGMGFSTRDHPRQMSDQGAIVCSEWPGAGPVLDEMRCGGDAIGSDARLLGLIAFLFACYGAGTPRYDEFALHTRPHETGQQGLMAADPAQLERIEIASRPFVARLPQRLLGHPRGGALAVVGHVDRAWSSSFVWESMQQTGVFESTLTRLLGGDRLGLAMEDFNNRYAELATELASRVEAIRFREIVPPEELAAFWCAANDARSFVVLGDPAVRLPGAAEPGPAGRAPVEAVAGPDAGPTPSGRISMSSTREPMPPPGRVRGVS